MFYFGSSSIASAVFEWMLKLRREMSSSKEEVMCQALRVTRGEMIDNAKGFLSC